ncbi:secretin N-terminal domain-containing protein [Verrucomicrobium sp. BvORR034]|uniref:secretin N-terminal domain-containing protein n=1 Tax=Verrucomicrobium sp. BvORR034 TaxID=1396418 RepID=UPI00067857BF|nr:secretin N-terminal domain-containing protein [Verrucomicrobium sp. BvORR034]
MSRQSSLPPLLSQRLLRQLLLWLLSLLITTSNQIHAITVDDSFWRQPTEVFKATTDASAATEAAKLKATVTQLCRGEGITPEFQNVDGLKKFTAPSPGMRTPFLQELLTKNGLDACFFKSTRSLLVFKPDAGFDRRYKLVPASFDALRAALQSSMAGPEMKFEQPTANLSLSGPDAYLNHMQNVAAKLGLRLEAASVAAPAPAPAAPAPVGKTAMIFPLKYARAEAERNQLRATVLGSATATGAVDVRESAGVVQILRNMLIADLAKPATDEPFITADPTRNAVIIVDDPGREPRYREIIDMLDVPRFMVEITAAIVDLEVSDGLDWQSSFLVRGTQKIESREVPFRVGFGADRRFFDTNPTTGAITGSPFDKDPPEIPAALTTGALGLNQTTLIVGSSYAVLSNIRALEQRGKAQVLSRPSVLTMDNQPARLTDQTSAVLPVAGERQSYLYKVASGLDLVVLPRIMNHPNGGPGKVYLGIEVGDGSLTDAEIASPNVAASTNDNRVITQAVVQTGESLLIGGRYRNQEVKSESGIPILSKIPVVGLPFKNKKVTNGRFQRLYLITPRIINPDNPQGPADDVIQATLGPQISIPIDPATMAEAGRPLNNTPAPRSTSPAVPPATPPPGQGDDVNPPPRRASWLKRLFKKNDP